MSWLIKARSGIYRMVDAGRIGEDQIISVNLHEFSEFIVKPKCNEKIFIVEEKKVEVKPVEKPVVLPEDPTPQPQAVQTIPETLPEVPEKKHVFKIKRKKA